MTENIDDPSALAIVMGDRYAPAFLMWWEMVGHTGESSGSAAIACRTTPHIVAEVHMRCEMAGLLTPTGITPLARKFVQTKVSKNLKAAK